MQPSRPKTSWADIFEDHQVVIAKKMSRISQLREIKRKINGNPYSVQFSSVVYSELTMQHVTGKC